MSWPLAALAVALAWGGWVVAVCAALTLRRRMALLADAEHELRGAATAIALAAQRLSREDELAALVRVEADRLTAALADLAAVRGARTPAPSAALDAGRLAQVLGNVAANAVEHGAGTVDVSASREAGVLRLEVSNRAREPALAPEAGARGRGIAIAKRAARALGGRLTVAGDGEATRAVIELPLRTDEPVDDARPAGGSDEQSAPADHRRAA